jgi:hypothetical protein
MHGDELSYDEDEAFEFLRKLMGIVGCVLLEDL